MSKLPMNEYMRQALGIDNRCRDFKLFVLDPQAVEKAKKRALKLEEEKMPIRTKAMSALDTVSNETFRSKINSSSRTPPSKNYINIKDNTLTMERVSESEFKAKYSTDNGP